MNEDNNDNDDMIMMIIMIMMMMMMIKEIKVKEINNNFKKIDETNSFEDQIDILKEIPWLNDCWDVLL